MYTPLLFFGEKRESPYTILPDFYLQCFLEMVLSLLLQHKKAPSRAENLKAGLLFISGNYRNIAA